MKILFILFILFFVAGKLLRKIGLFFLASEEDCLPEGEFSVEKYHGKFRRKHIYSIRSGDRVLLVKMRKYLKPRKG